MMLVNGRRHVTARIPASIAMVMMPKRGSGDANGDAGDDSTASGLGRPRLEHCQGRRQGGNNG
jgi:hypothetical protein